MKPRQARRILPAFGLVVGILLMGAMPVMALDGRAGDSVTVGGEEEIEEDLYLAGRTVATIGSIDGDVFAAGQTVSIGGDIEGGLTVAGQTVSVNADVARGVRVGGQTVDVNGAIGRDLVTGCATLIVNPESSIGGDLYVGAGQVTLRGDVTGDVYGGAEEIVFEGNVGGNVHVEVGSLKIAPHAVIEGNLWYAAPEEISIPQGSVKGDITFTQREVAEDSQRAAHGAGAMAPFVFFASLTWKIIAYLMALVTGIVLILVLPRVMAAAPLTIRTQTGPVAGWGAIALFLVPLASIVLCITVIGLPLGLIGLVLSGVLLYIAQLPVSMFIGYLILGRSRALKGKGFMIGCLALGLLLVKLAEAIPFAGAFISLAVALFGMGAFLVVDKRMLKALNASDWENET